MHHDTQETSESNVPTLSADYEGAMEGRNGDASWPEQKVKAVIGERPIGIFNAVERIDDSHYWVNALVVHLQT